MDDVALIANKQEEMQSMLKITDDIAKRYHIELYLKQLPTLILEGIGFQAKYPY